MTLHTRTGGLRSAAGASSLADIDQDLARLRERLEAAIEGAIAGTVNLIYTGRDEACRTSWMHYRLCQSGHAGDLGPGLEGLGPGGSILDGGDVVAAEVEQVIDLIVGGEEALGLPG